MQQRAALLSKATEEAAMERHRLLDEARQAADALSEKRAAAWQREFKTLHHEITRRTSQEVFAIARRTLGDLAHGHSLVAVGMPPGQAPMAQEVLCAFNGMRFVPQSAINSL